MMDVIPQNRTTFTHSKHHVSTPTRRGDTLPTTPRTTGVITPVSDPGNLVNATISPLNDREQMRVEFFRTYDVMTGVRIAATLGGFFGLMVLLVIYKSKCKSKSLSDEHLNACAAAVVEEEDNEIAASLEAAAYFSVNARSIRTGRMSLGNMSAPAMVLTRGARFSSIGGYTSLEPPACFYYQRGKSLPGSALRFAQQQSYCEDDELLDSPPPLAVPDQVEDEIAGPCSFYHQYLTVPSHSRRLSSITCSSADTSYLERKGSACELGLPPPPPFSFKDREKRSIEQQIQEPWDFYYPIDIQVIQPTPDTSPCGSERTLYDDPIRIKPAVERRQGSIAESISSITKQRLAPLASISSFGGALSDFPTGEPRSVGSDSVFFDNDVDTEDEVEGFATDSDEEIEASVGSKYRRQSQLDKSETTLPYSNHFLQVPFKVHAQTSAGSRWGESTSSRARRRLSMPDQRKGSRRLSISSRAASSSGGADVLPPTSDMDSHSCSCSCDRLVVDDRPVDRPPYPLPIDRSSSESVTLHSKTPLANMPSSMGPVLRTLRRHSVNFPSSGGSVDQVAKLIDKKTRPVQDKNGSWSQETLF